MDNIHKSQILELESVEIEAGPGGYLAGKPVFLSGATGITTLCNSEGIARSFIGIADEGKLVGETGTVRLTGTVTNSGWSWNIGDEIWVSPTTSGLLTTVASGSYLFVGKAIAPDKIIILPKTSSTQSTQVLYMADQMEQ
jgi:hypothetical protein